jgi:glycerate kinase
VDELDEGLKNLDAVFMKYFGRSIEVAPGAGAAGGMGGGCDVFLGARLVPGIDYLIESVSLDDKIAAADIVITGEGRLDEQSFQGKVIGKLVDQARKHGTKLYALCGETAMNIKDLNAMGVDRVVALSEFAGSSAESIANPGKFLSAAIKKIL